MQVTNCTNINNGVRCSYMIGPFTKDNCFPFFSDQVIDHVQCLKVEIGNLKATLKDRDIQIEMPENCPYMKERLF